MRIFFQNPTQGPLITVSFDNDAGPLLAFVPAAVDCGAKAATAAGVTAGASLTGIMAAATLFSGDSSPKRQPLGINRFAPKATVDGVEAARVDHAPATAVELPGEPTESATTAADATPMAAVAAALKTWDGAAPLEIAGFKFEKGADIDGKPTIKITITTDNVQDIIDVARIILTTFPKESHRLTVDVTHPNLGRAILKWGHRYFDSIIAEIVATRPQILAMNEKLARGETLSEEERALTEVLAQHIKNCNAAFGDDRDILNQLFNKLSPESKASQEWWGFIHDSGRRGKYLNNMRAIYRLLVFGEAVDDVLLEQLNGMGQLSLNYAIEYALTLTKKDLRQYQIQPAWHFNGNDKIPLATEEEFDTLVDILANLISNAARYSNPKKMGEVHITIRHTDDGLEIEVRDNGIGIPTNKLNDIGQFGFRVGEKPVDGSHGHGLWQVQRNLDDLGWGKLHVDSTHGEGSRFWFTISNRD